MKKFRNLSRTTKILIIAGTLILIAGTCVFAYKIFDKTSDLDAGSDTAYGPPTEEEKKQAEDNKTNADKRAELDKKSTQTQSAQKTQVPVVITSASVNGIYVYVNGVFEDGGSCTAEISQGNRQITRSSTAFKDVNKTSCAPIVLSRSDFPSSGIWAVKVSYSSSSSEGESRSANIEVE